MYNHSELRRWNNGEHQVQLDIPGRAVPMGYCDGTDEDEAELRNLAEEEGVDNLPIEKRLLKTGRQIWTLGLGQSDDDDDDDDE